MLLVRILFDASYGSYKWSRATCCKKKSVWIKVESLNTVVLLKNSLVYFSGEVVVWLCLSWVRSSKVLTARSDRLISIFGSPECLHVIHGIVLWWHTAVRILLRNDKCVCTHYDHTKLTADMKDRI